MRFLLLAAVLLVGCADAGAEPPRPLLWKISDADNHVYLLGTFHMLKPSDYPLDARVYAALDDAESVAFEIAPALMEGSQAAQLLATAGLRSDGRRLQDSLDTATWQRVAGSAKANGLPLDRLQSLDAWFVGLTLAMVELGKLGLDPTLGLDRHLAARAKSAAKPTLGLETLEAQVQVFDGMDSATQVAQLQEALEQGGREGRERVDTLHAQWRAGDERALYDGLASEMRERHPALFQRVNTDRNLAWLPQIEAMLARGADNDALVAVGSLHLIGPEGLVELLRAKGYRVERL